jgi:hypothetical protein
MTAALAIPPPIDLAPWRLNRDSDAYWATVEAAAREVTGDYCCSVTLTQALARFGYQRANGAICRNGRVVRRGSAPSTWIWLARVKRRIEGRRG